MSENVQALETAIEALEGLTDEHAAIVEQARTLARILDQAELSDSKLHSEYRQVLRTLLEVGKKKDLDAVAALLAQVREGAEKEAQPPESVH